MKTILRNKRVFVFICVLAMLTVMLVLNTQKAAAKNYNWKISQGIAEDHPAAARCKQFAKMVDEESRGRIKLTYFAAGALGDWKEQIEANRMGTLEISLNSGSTCYDPRGNLIFMPYLFATWDEVRAAIGSKGWLTPIFDEIYTNIGLKVLGIFLNAWDGMAYTERVNKVCKTPADYKGIKMRVPPIRIYEVFMPTLGFNPHPLLSPKHLRHCKRESSMPVHVVLPSKHTSCAMHYHIGLTHVIALNTGFSP